MKSQLQKLPKKELNLFFPAFSNQAKSDLTHLSVCISVCLCVCVCLCVIVVRVCMLISTSDNGKRITAHIFKVMMEKCPNQRHQHQQLSTGLAQVEPSWPTDQNPLKNGDNSSNYLWHAFVASTHIHKQTGLDDGQCWCASFVVCRLSLCTLHSFSSRLPSLSFCPFALSLYVRVMSDLFLQCDAQRKWEASPGQEHATRTHSWANMLCACVVYSRNSLCWYFHLKSI